VIEFLLKKIVKPLMFLACHGKIAIGAARGLGCEE
jgi:hypothetical protein